MEKVKVLVVEDEVLVGLELEDELQKAGYEVVLANNGHGGIGIVEELSGALKGIVTDIRLGAGPDGWEIAHRARELNPHIAIVYMSGDSAADWAANGVPNSQMIPKPFAIAQMVTAVSTLINASDQQP